MHTHELLHVLHSKSKSSSIPDDITADDFNYYFSTVGNNIGNIFDDNVTLPEFHVGLHNSFEFGTVTNTFVCRELCSLKNNLNLDVLGLDGYILSVAAHVLSPSLCFIFNRSLTLGYIPDDWKLARVTPLYKGTGCKTELGNYRPISVIAHIPNIIEKFVKCNLNKFLIENSLLQDDQFAYTKYQSTTSALHTIIDTVLDNINNSLLTGFVQIDLRKGFDTINHQILLYKLQKYGIDGNCLEWFKSYLYNRKQIVKINNKMSIPCILPIGVPQGTILGPLLFVLYTNDFCQHIYPVMSIRYADDTSLCACGYDIDEVQYKLQTGTDNALEWLKENRLLVNDNKSSTMLLGTRQRVSDLELKINISDVILNMCSETKLLGVVLDNYLSWDRHIEMIYKKVYPKIGVLYRLSKFISRPILNIIYNTLIQPDFDYCISVWGNCPKIHFERLQKLQNRAARIVCNEYDWNIPSLSLIKQLGWMSIEMRKDYFISVIMYKTINGSGLRYLFPNLTYTHQYHNYNTRAASNDMFILPKPKCELFKTSLQYYGIKLWNHLPYQIKNASNLEQFKDMCKKFIMDF